MIVMQADAVVSTAQTSSGVSLSGRFPEVPFHPNSTCGYYQIESTRQSECALVLFARHTLTSERVVMKILREYKDTRYNLETPHKRQQCQLEALKRNKAFTPEVYIGLAHIDYLDLPQRRFPINEIIREGASDVNIEQGVFIIDEIIRSPTQEVLDTGAEYALMMRQLPEERRLDHLLQEECYDTLTDYISLLSEYVAYMHTHLVTPLDTGEDEIQWGSYEQLQRKLLHNLELLDLVLATRENGRCDAYDQLEDTLHWLKKTLLQVFTESQYRCYFEQRAREQRIKHCHGDLKSLNMWILPCSQGCDEEPGGCVKILDAIDFNPSYSNIDTLSDFAMLVIDIQTRTKSPALANEMVEYYLELTGQDTQVARSVLAYYLVEKAIVGAAISIVYDHLPDLGLSLLEIASMRLKCLVERVHYSDESSRSMKPCPRTAMR